MKLIYLDNNATTEVAQTVVEAMQPYFTNKYANPSSLHFFGVDVAKDIFQARESIAKSINATPDEIFFTASGSEGDNLCIKGFAEANKHFGNHIITTVIEHPAVINSCKHLESSGFDVTYLPVDDQGFVLLDDLKNSIRPSTILVSVMHVNNEIGTIQPIKNIATICHSKNVAFHTDAVQSFLKERFDVKDMGIDMATFSGHKIHAPKGIGFVFIRKGISVSRQIDGGGQEYKIRAGTENTPHIIGLAKAISLASDDDRKKIRALQEYLLKRLQNIPGLRINGPLDLTRRAINNINFSSNSIDGDTLLQRLSERRICVSTGSACSSKSTRNSPVLEAIRCPIEYIHGNVRISLSRYNTLEDLDMLISSLTDILQKITTKITSESI